MGVRTDNTMNYIEWLNTTIGMPEEPAALCREWCPKLASTELYGEIKRKFFAQASIDEELNKYAEENGLHIWAVQLIAAELLSAEMRAIYAERGYDEEIFVDSVRDIAIWTKVTMRDDKVVGLRNLSWMSHQLRCTMFRLGRMQYHLIKYKETPYEAGGFSVKDGDTVINIHIPEGDSLTKEKRIDSYKRAFEFFGGKYNTFTCHSYLFYEKHLEFLPENSNIRDFMGDFHLCDFTEKEGDDNLWRIFDKRESYDPKTLPRDTSLRRAYAEHLEKDGMKVGSGRGIFFFDGEKFYK